MVKPKLPAHMQVHALWADQDEGGDGDMIAYITERQRRRIGMLVALPGFVLDAVLVLVKAPLPILLVVAGLVIAAAVYAMSGKAGWYIVREDGELG